LRLHRFGGGIDSRGDFTFGLAPWLDSLRRRWWRQVTNQLH
jgi:hypothetical protein